MRIPIVLSICSVLAVLALPVSAQETPEAFLKRSLAAYGSTDKIETIAYHFDGTSSNRWQSHDPSRIESLPTKAVATLRPASGDYRLETEQRFPGGYLFHFVSIGLGDSAHTYDASGSRFGKTLIDLDAKGKANQFTQSMDRLPFSIVRGLLSRAEKTPASFSIQQDKDEATQIIETNGTPVQYTFEPHTQRLQRIALSRRVATGDTVQIVTEFLHEKMFDGLWQAAEIRISQRGKITRSDTAEHLRTLLINAEPKGSSWAIPKDRKSSANAPDFQVEHLSENFINLYDSGSDRNLPFFRSGNEVTAFDAPVSPALTARALAELHKQWPDARLAHVVISHFHNDHVSGLAPYLAQGAQVHSSALAQPMLEELLKVQGVAIAPTTFVVMTGAAAKAVVPGLDLYEVPNSHVRGMVIAHLPQEGLIYEGDLLSIPSDGTLTKPLEANRDLFNFLKTRPLAFTRMIGHHGHNRITPATLKALQKKAP
jgi:glyoxylase-like metal-dependent hydrolase (beta-lactamase superfamily II)